MPRRPGDAAGLPQLLHLIARRLGDMNVQQRTAPASAATGGRRRNRSRGMLEGFDHP